MKTVFSNMAECSHVYAQFSQDHGKSGNVSFKGDTFYSYGWWPVCHRSDKYLNGKQVIFFRNDFYSSSTSKHQSRVLRAIDNDLYEIVYCYDLDPTDVTFKEIAATNFNLGIENVGKAERAISNYDYYIEAAKNHLSKARLLDGETYTEETIKGIFSDLNDLYTKKAKQAETRKERKEKRLYKTFLKNYGNDLTEIGSCIKFSDRATIYNKLRFYKDLRHNKNMSAIDQENRADIIDKYNSALYQIEKEKIDNWLKGEGHNWQSFSKTYLRIKGNKVETSRGATVPLERAIKLLKMYKHGAKVEGFEIGHYTVNSRIDGGIKIGCHTILDEQINIFAQTWKKLSLV